MSNTTTANTAAELAKPDLKSYYFAAFNTECPDIAFFTDRKEREKWVKAAPVERTRIRNITDALWLTRPEKILKAIVNGKTDADGIHWLNFDEEA